MLIPGGIDPAAWTPKMWGSRGEWHFDATIASSITVATGVSLWADQFSKARNMSNGTAGAQPANGGDINGRNAISFSPASTIDVLDSFGLTALSTTTLATFLVGKLGSGSGNYARLGGLVVGAGSDETDAGAFAIERVGTTEAIQVQRNSVGTSTQAITYDVPFIIVVVWDGTTMQMRPKNIVLSSTASTGTFVGDRLWAGYNLSGAIGEWIGVRGPFTGAEVARQYKALSAKWRIPV